MKSINETVREKVTKNKLLFSSLRRSDIAMQLRQCMLAKGIKSSDLAERLNVSESNISRWLKGNQNLKLDNLYLIADALETPLTIVVGRVSGASQSIFNDDCKRDFNGGEWLDPLIERSGQPTDLSYFAKLRSAKNEAKFAPAVSELNMSILEFEDVRATAAA